MPLREVRDIGVVLFGLEEQGIRYLVIQGPVPGRKLRVALSTTDEWEHVSVVVQDGKKERTPTWVEMCYIKNRFWEDEDCVVQYHPPKADYINHHQYALHLWRYTAGPFPQPDTTT